LAGVRLGFDVGLGYLGFIDQPKYLIELVLLLLRAKGESSHFEEQLEHEFGALKRMGVVASLEQRATSLCQVMAQTAPLQNIEFLGTELLLGDGVVDCQVQH